MTQPQTAWDWINDHDGWWSSFNRPLTSSPSLPWHFVEVDAEMAGGDPYDFWRESVFYGFEAGSRNSSLSRFRANAEVVASPRGEFVYSDSAELVGGRSRKSIEGDGSGGISIGLMLDGKREYEAGDMRIGTGPGEFYIYDTQVASRLSLTEHKMAYLALPRAEFVAKEGDGHVSQFQAHKRLAASPLLPFLKMHLNMLVHSQHHPGSAVTGRLLSAAIDLAELIIDHLNMIDNQKRHPRRGLVVAAQHLMSQRLDDLDLGPDLLAAMLGSSRSTLYRAFAQEGLTVAGQIKNMRLTKARYLLEHSPSSEQISDIIGSCGLDDAVHFSRSFRQLFGIRPKEIKGMRACYK